MSDENTLNIDILEIKEKGFRLFDTTANSAVLGFAGLALAAVMLGLQGIGLFGDALVVISMSIFIGGFAQVFAGIQLWWKGNNFAGTAFTAFGLFWFSFAYILIAPFGALIAGASSMAWFLLFWGIFATGLTLGTLKLGSKILIVVFVLLDLTFFLTAISFFGVNLSILPGIITLLLGLASLYASLGTILNECGYKLPL
ncbi:Succinate-acetate/proton symporter SatP [Methanosarcinaceae archaeon Ag5]|uniref:Succinate-acetate/proton symporter SatP n=1 Tax=Methanolapillus africanus TaxID=3028297 RepID=A0AAE4ML02_9EURY|nr:Succinate-acetate/proton symporter SatP [Methanosarcinaceae archaeon Ag5]